MDPSVSLIIPVYNEERLIRAAVENSIAALSRDFKDFEIILVDDGSTDGTASVMDELAAKDRRVVVIKNLVNLNVGISIQRAFAAATKDFVVHDAVDMPLAASDVSQLIPHMKETDVLVLERKSHAGYSPWRWICSHGNRALIRAFFSPGITDLNFTQMYRREVLKQIMPMAKSPAFTTPEMIIRAKQQCFRVKSITWDYKPRSEGKGAFGKPHDILWSMYDMFRFRARFKAPAQLKYESKRTLKQS